MYENSYILLIIITFTFLNLITTIKNIQKHVVEYKIQLLKTRILFALYGLNGILLQKNLQKKLVWELAKKN